MMMFIMNIFDLVRFQLNGVGKGILEYILQILITSLGINLYINIFVCRKIYINPTARGQKAYKEILI